MFFLNVQDVFWKVRPTRTSLIESKPNPACNKKRRGSTRSNPNSESFLAPEKSSNLTRCRWFFKLLGIGLLLILQWRMMRDVALISLFAADVSSGWWLRYPYHLTNHIWKKASKLKLVVKCDAATRLYEI